MKPPRLEPNQPAVKACVRIASRPLTAKQQLPSRQPFVASYSDEPACWWKLTKSTKSGSCRRLWWAPLGARRWRECPEFIQPDDEGKLRIWTEHPTTSQSDKESLEGTLLMLHEAALIQACERLDRRAADARRRRAQNLAHPPRQCCCCGCTFTPKRADARCCSGRCRAKLSRDRASDACCGTECN